MVDVLRTHKRKGKKSPPHSSRGRLYPQEMKKKIDKSLEEIEKRISSTVGDKDKKKSVEAFPPVPKQKPTPPSETKIPAAVKPLLKSEDDGKKVIEVSKDKEPSKTLQKQYGEWSEKNPETFWNRLGKSLDVSVEYDYPGEKDNYKKGGKVAKRKMGAKVSKPRGCGAALRGYGKAMKKGK